MEKIAVFFRKLREDLAKSDKKKLDGWLKLIIGELAVKGILLWLLSLPLLPLFSRQTILFLHHVARRSHLLSNAQFVTRLFVRIDETPERRFLILSIFFLIWGATDLIEAVGIWQRKRWAEYMAVVGTLIFIPVEIYTIVTRFNWEKLAVSVFNLFIIIYIIRSRKLFQFSK